jgi:hypothetical protein
MEQNPSSEANSHSASQEIPRLQWNPKVHYRVHKDQLLVPILIQMHPVHTITDWFLRPILILSSQLCLCLPNGLLTSSVGTKILYASHIPRVCYVLHPFHPCFENPYNIW